MNNISIPWPGWKLIKELGYGANGSVYEIQRDDGFGKQEHSALKIISIPKQRGEIEMLLANGHTNQSIIDRYNEYLHRIINEYDIMNSLEANPNIVRCYDRIPVAQGDGIGWDVFIRMELLTPLMQFCRSEQLDEADVARLGADICRALVACERKHIIHRDIKPENIFIDENGVFKLGDFGVARSMDGMTNATITGTYRYMAPEIVKGEKYGKSVDIYSLGMVLYWLLNNNRTPFLPTDRPPTVSDEERAITMRFNGSPVPAPIRGCSALHSVILKAISFSPSERYSSASEMLNALLAIDTSKTAPAQREELVKPDSTSIAASGRVDDSGRNTSAEESDPDKTTAIAAARRVDNPVRNTSDEGSDFDKTTAVFGSDAIHTNTPASFHQPPQGKDANAAEPAPAKKIASSGNTPNTPSISLEAAYGRFFSSGKMQQALQMLSSMDPRRQAEACGSLLDPKRLSFGEFFLLFIRIFMPLNFVFYILFSGFSDVSPVFLLVFLAAGVSIAIAAFIIKPCIRAKNYKLVTKYLL